MKKMTRKLLLSILTVVLTVIVLGTTTFAWFTITNVATVQAYDAELKANEGIEIALGAVPLAGPDQLNWVTNLTASTIEQYIFTELANGPDGFRFDHVTTANGVNFYTLFAGDTGYEQTPTTAGYIELPLHFRSDTADGIDWTGLTLSSTPIAWNTDVAFTNVGDTEATAVGTLLSVDPTDSVRISFTGSVLVETVPTSVTTLFEKPAQGNNVVLGTGGDLSNGGLGIAGAMNYFYAKNGVLPVGSAAVSVPSAITSVGSIRIVDLTLNSDTESLSYAGANYYGSVIVRIWIEGWDANAYNAILGGTISTAMEFTGSSIE